MRKLVVLAGVVFTVGMSSAAVAQTGLSYGSGPNYYGNLGYSQIDHDDGNLGAITGRLGARFNPNFGVEAETSFGLKDHKYHVLDVEGRVKHSYDLAAYLVGAVPVSDRVDLFVRGGFGTTKIKSELGGERVSSDGTSWNYGAGANYYFDAQNGVRADWTRRDFTKSDAPKVDVWSVSYVRRF